MTAESGGTVSYRRAEAVVEKAVEDDLFLVVPGSEEIYHLNAVGAALWRLLAEPCAMDEIVETLDLAFAETPRAQIRDEVGAFLDDLVSHGLVRRLDDG